MSATVRVAALAGLALLAACGSDHAGAPDDTASVSTSELSSFAVFRVRDINPGIFSSLPDSLMDVGGTAFFTADDGFHRRQIWRSDGTEPGTVMVKDLGAAAAQFSGPQFLAPIARTLFFQALDAATGAELWRTDGTNAGTVLVKDAWPGPSGSYPTGAVNVGGILFYAAQDAEHGSEPWRSDGTAAGTAMIADVHPGGGSSGPRDLTPLGGAVFFLGYGPAPVYGRDGLWKTDGTAGGTVLVRDIGAVGAFATRFLVRAGSRLFFVADDGAHGAELWTSDGTTAGTVLVKDINPGGISNIENIVAFAGRVYFEANDGVHGRELWTSDGTPEGTAMVKDVNPAGGGGALGLTVFRGRLAFVANDGVHGAEIWTSDGTAAGTVMAAETVPGPGSVFGTGDVAFLTASGPYLYFAATEEATGTELWAFGPPPATPPSTPSATPPPAGPNHPPEITGFSAFPNISTGSVSLDVSDPDGDDVRWTITLSRDDGKTGVGSISCDVECTAIQVLPNGVSGVLRSGHGVGLRYNGVEASPTHPEGSVILTANADDGRGGHAAPQSVRVLIF